MYNCILFILKRTLFLYSLNIFEIKMHLKVWDIVHFLSFLLVHTQMLHIIIINV